jgi:hypothetical protein
MRREELGDLTAFLTVAEERSFFALIVDALRRRN